MIVHCWYNIEYILLILFLILCVIANCNNRRLTTNTNQLDNENAPLNKLEKMMIQLMLNINSMQFMRLNILMVQPMVEEQ